MQNSQNNMIKVKLSDFMTKCLKKDWYGKYSSWTWYFIYHIIFKVILAKLENIPLANVYLPDGIIRQSLTKNFIMILSY